MRSLLRSAGIGHVVQGGEAAGLFPLGPWGGGSLRRYLAATVLVSAHREAEARRLLDEVEAQAGESSSAEAREELASPPRGRLVGIAVRPSSGAPMAERRSERVDERDGLAGDHRSRPGKRQLTVLTREGWQAACAELGRTLVWTARRANLLVEGVDLREAVGFRLRVGEVLLEITGETRPCRHIEVQPGLREALEPEWRGGVTCGVLEGGRLAVGDAVDLSAV